MAEISLRAYVQHIDTLLANDANTEAIAHCRHILESYPKYIDVYTLLARALTAQEQYQDAIDLFQRVLSADPNDFIAHIGMSDCYRESRALDQAIWHLERAFEQVPSNPDIQEAIKGLYKERDGIAPRKIQLTSGALARLYAKGELYQQSIGELTQAIAKSPERLDLQVLLAETLWNSHRIVDSGKVAGEIHKRLPYSIDANRLLARLWLHTGRSAEARPFIERVRETNPYLGLELSQDGKTAPDNAFGITRLHYVAEEHAVTSGGAADWVSQLSSIQKEKNVTGPLNPASIPSAGIDAPDWLTNLQTGKLPPLPTENLPAGVDLDELLSLSADDPPAAPASLPLPETQAEAPDWLSDLAGDTPAVAPEVSTPSAESAAPDWLDDLAGGTPSPAPLDSSPSSPSSSPSASAPDWLDDLAGGDTPAPSEPVTVTPESSEGDDSPAWLNDILGEETVPEPVVAVPEPPKDDGDAAPDWLQDVLNESTEPQAAVSVDTNAETMLEEVSDDWLDNFLTTDQGASPISEGASDPSPTEGVPLNFLDGIGAGIQSDASADDKDKDLDTWDDLPEAEVAPSPIADLPPMGDDWLTQEIDLGEPEKDEAPDTASDTIPDWLKEPEGDQVDDDQTDKIDTIDPDLSDKQSAAMDAPALEEENIMVPPPDDQETPDFLADGDLDNEDAALAWLEELAAKYDPDYVASGASESTEAESEETEAEPEPEVVAEVEESIPEADVFAEEEPVAEEEAEPAVTSADDDIPDWLKASSEPESTPTEPAASEPVVPEPVAASAEDDLPDWLSSSPDSDPIPTEPAEAEPVVASADDDLPDWLSSSSDSDPLADIPAASTEDDVPDWLSGSPAATSESADDLEWLRSPSEDADPLTLGGAEEDLPDWLSGTPSVPVESESEPVASTPEPEPAAPPVESTPEPAEASAAPTQPAADDAMDWLDDQVSEQGISPEMVVSEELKPDQPPVKADIDIPPPDAVAEPASAGDLPDWLQGVDTEAEIAAADEGGFGDELDLSGLELDDIKVDEDELDWLSAPASASSGDSLDDFLNDEPDVTPEPAAAPVAETPPTPEPVPAAPVAEETLPEPEPEPAPPVAEAPPAPEPIAVPDEAEELPTWMTTSEDDLLSGSGGLTDFLQAVSPAETSPPPAAPAPTQAPVPVSSPPPVAASAPSVQQSAPSPSVGGEDYRQNPSAIGDYMGHLTQARDAMSKGDFDTALSSYEGLIANNEHLFDVIDDLTTHVKSQSVVKPRIYRLLGDAYMTDGKTDEALAMYQLALDKF